VGGAAPQAFEGGGAPGGSCLAWTWDLSSLCAPCSAPTVVQPRGWLLVVLSSGSGRCLLVSGLGKNGQSLWASSAPRLPRAVNGARGTAPPIKAPSLVHGGVGSPRCSARRRRGHGPRRSLCPLKARGSGDHGGIEAAQCREVWGGVTRGPGL
jgi:hypothetical protein